MVKTATLADGRRDATMASVDDAAVTAVRRPSLRRCLQSRRSRRASSPLWSIGVTATRCADCQLPGRAALRRRCPPRAAGRRLCAPAGGAGVGVDLDHLPECRVSADVSVPVENPRGEQKYLTIRTWSWLAALARSRFSPAGARRHSLQARARAAR